MKRPRIQTPLHLEGLREVILQQRRERHLALTGNLEEDLKSAKQNWVLRNRFLENESGVKIDTEDLFWVWDRSVRVDVYAQISIKGEVYRLHSLFCPNFSNGFTDHINQDKLDNRRCNLRPASISESNVNRPYKRPKRSVYRGVCPYSCVKNGKTYTYWRAVAFFNGKQTQFGLRKTERAAAILYNSKIKEVHGEFAILNDISD